MARRLNLVVMAAVAVLVTGSAASTDVHLEWFPCPNAANLTCTYLSVPVDYHDASAGNGQLLVVKANATASERKGTIFLNPGGPGVSGLTSLVENADGLLNRTGGAYDFVSWDPRGVGPYTYPGNVYCLSDEEFDTFWNGTIEATGINYLGDFTNKTDLAALAAQAPVVDIKYRQFAEKCLQGPNGTTLRYVGTTATVRDLVTLADVIVGPESEINYWGLSYGTYVGMIFANMFPQRVGHVILDGIIDATKLGTAQSYLLWKDQIGSVEDVYSAFANACAMAGPSECKLAPFEGASGADVVDYLSSVLKTVHAHPHANDMLLLRAMIYSNLYQPEMWESNANSMFPNLIASILGSSNSSAQARDFLRKRDTFSMNSYTEPAVVCADSVDADPSVVTDVIFKEILNDTRAVSHTAGALWPIPWYRCSYWPVRAVERYQGPWNTTFAHKILLIGNLFDNATPFFEAQHTAEILGDQAALVRQDGFGHTSIAQSSQCVSEIIQAYLNDGTLPSGTASAPTVCAIDDSVELFPGVQSIHVRTNGTFADRK